MSRTHYLAELESVRRNLVEMGETTLALFDDAVGVISEPNADCTAKAGDPATRVRDPCGLRIFVRKAYTTNVGSGRGNDIRRSHANFRPSCENSAPRRVCSRSGNRSRFER